MTDKQKAERLMSWIEAVIAIHGVDEARRAWDACASREKGAARAGQGSAPLATAPPKPSGWLK
jgi:hypothetical protein